MHIKHAIFGLILLVTTPAFAGGATKVNDAIWNDGHLYGTVVTPTSFVAPPEHSTDTIYNFSMSGLAGQRGIAEAAPGDTDFNGGRWSVVMAVFTNEGKAVLGDGSGNVYEEITNDTDMLNYVDLGYIELFPTGFYFECPMLP
ncbi:MAG: hypothetical protein ACE5FN_03970 [Leptospirillia bacterium]